MKNDNQVLLTDKSWGKEVEEVGGEDSSLASLCSFASWQAPRANPQVRTNKADPSHLSVA